MGCKRWACAMVVCMKRLEACERWNGKRETLTSGGVGERERSRAVTSADNSTVVACDAELVNGAKERKRKRVG